MLTRAAVPRPDRRDLVDAGLVVLLGVAGSLATLSGNYDGPSVAHALLWDWVMVLPLLVRRRAPGGTWWAVLLLMTVQATLPGSIDAVGTFFGLLVACYTLAARCTRRTAVAGLVALVPVLVYGNWSDSGNPFEDLAFLVALAVGFWVAGRVVWSREQLVRRLADQAEALERGREAEARARIAEQRARVARDVHDVVAHSVSIIVVQAEAGEAQLSPDHPAAECLRAIQRVGRSTLTELRGVLATLGDDRDPAGAGPALAPTPRLRDAPALVADLRAAGLDVDLRVAGEPTVLPIGVDLAAYRILQEALTNALRHAAGARVTAHVTVTGGDVVVEVADSGPGSHRVVEGTGRGLVGMRERVRLYGGEVECGPAGDGFRVRARIPVAPGVVARP